MGNSFALVSSVRIVATFCASPVATAVLPEVFISTGDLLPVIARSGPPWQQFMRYVGCHLLAAALGSSAAAIDTLGGASPSV